MATKKQTFEQALDKLEDIVAQMEDGDTGIEECVKLYKEGVTLSLFCSERLNSIEKEVTMLQEMASGNIKEKPFHS